MSRTAVAERTRELGIRLALGATSLQAVAAAAAPGLVLAAIGVAIGLVPALRIVRLDPIRALRTM